jgi:hypothetical protein
MMMPSLNNTMVPLSKGYVVVHNTMTGVVSRALRPRDTRKKLPKGCMVAVVIDDRAEVGDTMRVVVGGRTGVRVDAAAFHEKP